MKLAILKSAFIIATVALTSICIAAQGQRPPESQAQGRESQKHDLFRDLGLTKEQIDRIRELRRSGREDFMAAQRKLREANKALDIAIYADVLDGQLIETRIAEQNIAQAEVGRLKTMNELNLRKILTPEQLVKFREIRQMYAKRQSEMKARREARQNDRRRRKGDDDREP